jgi:hypothetical protein
MVNNEELEFIKEHDYYYTPSKGYSKYIMDRNKLSDSNISYFQELCRFFSHQSLNSEDYIADEFLDSSKFDSEMSKQIEQNKAFYKELYDTYVPGYTPTEKAVYLMHYISLKQKETGDEKPEEQPNFFQTFQKETPKQEYFESSTINLLKENHKRIKDFKGDLEFFKKMSLVDSFGNSFEIKKSRSQKRVPNSIQTKQKKITEFEDIIKSPLYQMVYPDFLVKLAQKDLICNTPVVSEEFKQKIIVLVDFSG